MLDIRDLIRQLSRDEYESFYNALVEKKAEKSIHLLSLLRESSKSDKDISDLLNVNSTAYYTLRSRLNDKIQDFLMRKVKGSKVEVLEKVNNIDYILFNYNRTQAINIIKKLEDELIRYEKPTYLIKVYDALKRLHKSSPSYYNYSQQYNQHVAFLLDYDKLVELLGDFIAALGNYTHSKLPDDHEHMTLIFEQINGQDIRDSHRMYVIQAIAQISYQLFLHEDDQTVEIEPVEDILHQLYKILEAHPEDSLYTNLKLLFDYLSFEYYHSYKIRKKEDEYYILVEEEVVKFVNSYTYYTISTQFLISQVERALKKNSVHQIYNQWKEQVKNIEIPKEDTVNYINFFIFSATCCFYNNKYEEASEHLNNLRNNVIFKNIPHAEVEVKLFMALIYLLMQEHELCNSLLKSVGRKVLTHQHYEYENAKIFKKILLIISGSGYKGNEEKIKRLLLEYNAYNKGKYAILPYIRINEELLSKIGLN